MSKTMLYITFFTAVAGMLLCMYKIFNQELSYTNLIMFIFFGVIVCIGAIIDRDMNESKNSNQ